MTMDNNEQDNLQETILPQVEEIKSQSMKREIEMLSELIKAKEENIGTLKKLVKLLEEKVEKLSRK